MRKSPPVSVDQFRRLSKAPNLEDDLMRAYASLKKAYARCELELLQAMKMLAPRLNDPAVRAAVAAYDLRTSVDPNFLEAIQSSAMSDKKLDSLSGGGECEAHAAMSRIFAAEGHAASSLSAVDVNMLRQMQPPGPHIGFDDQPEIVFGDPPDPSKRALEREAKALMRDQRKMPKVDMAALEKARGKVSARQSPRAR